MSLSLSLIVIESVCVVIPVFMCPPPLTPQTSFPPGEDKCRWFGRYLLEGRVCPAVKALKLSCLPSVITNKAPQRRVAVLVGALANGGPPVTSKAALRARLAASPAYFGDVIRMWAQKGTEPAAAAAWAAAVKELLHE